MPSTPEAASRSTEPLDVLIIGAGPVGLACAIESRRAGLQAAVIDKGALVNSIVGYPARMEFFSTPELIEIGGYPFPVQGYKPTREDAIEYYRGVCEREGLDVRLYERVEAASGKRDDFTVRTSRGSYRTRTIVVATGFFDKPNRLNVPGEDLPKVTHYYREPYPYVRQKVAVIGAKNSAAKAALDCYRHGAEVSLIVRAPALSDKIKYWIPSGSREPHQGREHHGILLRADPRDHRDDDPVPLRRSRSRDRQRLGARDDRLPPRLQLSRIDRRDVRRRWLSNADLQPDHLRNHVRRSLSGGNGVRRLPDEPLVHRERPFPRPANRATHRRKGRGTDPLRRHSLEDGGVGKPAPSFQFPVPADVRRATCEVLSAGEAARRSAACGPRSASALP